MSCAKYGVSTMTRRRLTDEEIIAQAREATQREEEDRTAGLRADAAWYDAASGYLMMRMTNRWLFGVRVKDIPYLKSYTPAELAAVTLSPSGGGLHWDAKNMHLDVPSLLFDAFGDAGSASMWSRAAGKRTSPAKAKSSRANGAKGGRPRKRKAA